MCQRRLYGQRSFTSRRRRVGIVSSRTWCGKALLGSPACRDLTVRGKRCGRCIARSVLAVIGQQRALTAHWCYPVRQLAILVRRLVGIRPPASVEGRSVINRSSWIAFPTVREPRLLWCSLTAEERHPRSLSMTANCTRWLLTEPERWPVAALPCATYDRSDPGTRQAPSVSEIDAAPVGQNVEGPCVDLNRFVRDAGHVGQDISGQVASTPFVALRNRT